jgi:hypothetical protein
LIRIQENIFEYNKNTHFWNDGPKFIVCNTQDKYPHSTGSNAFSWSSDITAAAL